MASINAAIAGGGGVITTSDATGNLDIQSGGSTVVGVTSTGATVTGTLAATGASTFTGTGKFATTIGVGNATPSASGSGITFPATQSASSDANTLDDYEEGTWTPSLRFGGLTTGITYSVQNGTYTKVGNLVFIRVTLVLSSKGSATGTATIASVPFNSIGAAAGGTGFTLVFSDAMASITGNVLNEVEAANVVINCNQTTATASPVLTNSNFTNTSNYQFSGCYQSA